MQNLLFWEQMQTHLTWVSSWRLAALRSAAARRRRVFLAPLLQVCEAHVCQLLEVQRLRENRGASSFAVGTAPFSVGKGNQKEDPSHLGGPQKKKPKPLTGNLSLGFQPGNGG